MTVDVFVITYNEQEILPHFVQHYREKFNASTIVVYDNKSTDKTRQIALDLNCNLKTYDTNGQLNDEAYLKIKNSCWKTSKADWVIIADCDEFLEVNFDISKYTIINTQGYDIVGDFESRLGVKNNKMNKHLMFSPKHINQINYSFGCHKCEPKGNIIGSKEIATLMHRKFISEEYLFKKHLEYEKRLSAFNKKYNFGFEYQNVSIEKIKQQFEELRKNATFIK